jgi:hypothetical protein
VREWTAWWAGELDRPLVLLECIKPQDRHDPHCASVFLGNHPLDTPADTILNEFVPRLENTHYLGDSFPRFWPNFGPGIVAAFAGAQVHPAWDTTGKLCQVTVSPEGALTIIRELGGKGFTFVIDEPQLTPTEGQTVLEELENRL